MDKKKQNDVIDTVLSGLFIILTAAVMLYWEWLPGIIETIRGYINI